MKKKTDSNLIELSHVYKSYGQKEVLKDVNIQIGKGKIVGLLGPNGSGKTTIIKLINDLLVPNEGTIKIVGYEPGVETKKLISYLPERNSLDINMRIEELILYFKDFYQDFNEKRAYELLKKLNINPHDKLKTMSKGTREKVQLMLVMSREAKVYILDEPIGGVDPATRDYILDTILSSFDEDASIIISTHLIADVERILDEVIFISDGKVVLDTTADEIRKERGLSIDQLFREEFKC